MSFLAYVKALIDQWERGIRDPEDVVREIRKALAEDLAETPIPLGSGS